MLQFFDKAHLQSELLDEDDDDLFSGSNPNAIEDHFFDFEEFDKKKKKKKWGRQWVIAIDIKLIGVL